jgi:8-amino-7-oxononanoate synthase
MKDLESRLAKRTEEGLRRELRSYEGLTDFLSNDYLGFAKENESVIQSGSTGSRLISGNSKDFEDAESGLAVFFGYPSAMVLNSGYDANLAIFSAIPDRNSVVLYDKLIHASVRDGIRLGVARAYGFEHNDVCDLKRLLERHKEQICYVAVEGLYSMNGDLSPLREISELTERYNARLIVDEAHSAGIWGQNGRGFTSELGLDASVFLKLVTFGKAYGMHGACILTSRVVKEVLINFARPFIYTTALPEQHAKRMLVRVKDASIKERRERLMSKIQTFRKGVDKALLNSNDRSPIQILQTDVAKLKKVEEQLLKNGIASKLILPPTVPTGEECIRICIHEFNTEEEIDKLNSIINQLT